MERDLNFSLPSDDVVIRHDMSLARDDDAGSLALGGIIPHLRPATPRVDHPLTADSRGINADDRGHHRLGEIGVFVVEPRQQFHIAHIEW